MARWANVKINKCKTRCWCWCCANAIGLNETIPMYKFDYFDVIISTRNQYVLHTQLHTNAHARIPSDLIFRSGTNWKVLSSTILSNVLRVAVSVFWVRVWVCLNIGAWFTQAEDIMWLRCNQMEFWHMFESIRISWNRMSSRTHAHSFIALVIILFKLNVL